MRSAAEPPADAVGGRARHEPVPVRRKLCCTRAIVPGATEPAVERDWARCVCEGCYRARVRGVSLVILLSLLGCKPQEPPSWPRGGAALSIAEARWDLGLGEVIVIRSDGRVFEGGDLLFVIDRVGRLVDSDDEPVAILLPDGRVFGTDERLLGQVGVTNAAPPWSAQAWLAVTPDGSVTQFGPEGDRVSLGRWQGCHGAALRACTLVTHLVLLRHASAQPGSGLRVGVGVGIGF